MKKNAMLKIAAILMVAVLLTTCAISSTFAKYVTTGTDDNVSARVAKWGVDVTVTTDDAFYTNYNNGTEDIVVSGTTVVAPGTHNENAITITVQGAPEVDAEIAATGNFLQLGDNWKSGGADYCPLIFKVGTENYYVGKTGIASVNELQTAVNNAITSALNVELEAGATTNISVTVGWTWNFVQPTDLTGLTGFVQDNAKDTDLGDTVADETPNNEPTVSFDATVTVSQTGSNFATNGAYAAPADPEGE